MDVSSNDFRVGLTIEVDGSPFKVIEHLHVKPGKGAAFVRTKLKNLLTGNTMERTFRAGESVPEAQVEKAEMQYTYQEENDYVFMNMTTFEEERIPTGIVGDTSKYLRVGQDVSVTKWNGKPIEVEVPTTMTLEVVETDPGVRGNTAQGGSKPAKLETGVTIQVPLFIEVGEKIKVDTRTGTYLSRA
jgi:translation elongation factor P